MDHAEIVEKSIHALEAGDIDHLNKYLSDNMTFYGVVLGQLGKQEFIEIMKALSTGLPDWSFNHKITLVTGSQVMVKIQVTATHTQALHLPGIPPIEATDKRIIMPKEMLRFMLDGDQITEIHVEPVEGGDLNGLLARLGVEVPATDSSSTSHN